MALRGSLLLSKPVSCEEKHSEPGMVVPTCSPGTQEAEIRGHLQIRGSSWLYRECKTSPGYIVRP